MYKTSITKEEINNLPVSSFTGKIILIDELSKVKDAVSLLKNQRILGFDTETKPSFKKGLHNINNVALLQLATTNTVVLFRLNRIGIPDNLISVLTDTKILKIGAAIHDDIKSLQKLNHFVPGGFIDIQQFVKDFGIEHSGVRKLTALILNIKISKSQQLSNWENETLTGSQQTYAATDAWACLEIYRKIIG